MPPIKDTSKTTSKAPTQGEIAAESTPLGKKAPALNLNDQAGKTHKLADYAGKWVVLFFYPRDNTSGCTKEACQFRDQSAVFAKANAVILGVSPDDETSHEKFATKFNLPFPLLADTQKKLCEAYGVWQEKNMYGIKRMGVVRTTVLIDPAGKTAWRWHKVKVAGHDDAVLEKIKELSK